MQIILREISHGLFEPEETQHNVVLNLYYHCTNNTHRISQRQLEYDFKEIFKSHDLEILIISKEEIVV